MPTTLPPVAAAYVRSTNEGDSAAFLDLFAADAFVDDARREFRGLAEIKAWSDREVFAAQVQLEVLATEVLEASASETDAATVITTRVDGNFDRTGLPDPLVLTHRIQTEGDQIARLTIRLAE